MRVQKRVREDFTEDFTEDFMENRGEIIKRDLDYLRLLTKSFPTAN